MEDDPYEAIFDDKLDDQLTLQDNIDGEWVHLMTAGPLSVNYVGNLLVLASKRDFPLSHSPNFPFQYIKNPGSFRATLAQVSGSMYSALLGAHTAMDRIQLNIQQVPNHVKTALKLVVAGSPMLIEIMLPKTLETIGRIADESAAHARTTFQKFSSLQELIAEIIEANTNTHSTQAVIVEQIQSQINQAKHEQQNLNNNVNSIKDQYENARRELERARQEYQAAYNAIPTARGWFKKVFRAIIRTVVAIVTAPARILGCILGLCYSNQAALNAAAVAAETAKQNAIAKANQLLEVLKDAEQRHAAFAQQQIAEQQKLASIINKIAGLDLDRMSEQEIVDILIESILQMNQIREQWGRLIQFFSKLSVQADSTQQVSNQNVLQRIECILTFRI
jgi:DNA segregation ATPase FtsK/SpoIIIE-like protein